jgi:glycosyltransferase involved in cell wall biosynthesis
MHDPVCPAVLPMSNTSLPRGAPIRSISALLPAYNEAANIAYVVDATLDALHDAVPDFEIIVVDDGSTDATPSLCAGITARHPMVHVMRHSRNTGYGSAVRSGIAAATKQYVFLMAANRRFNPAEISRLIQWGDQYDVVAGYRLQRQDPFYRVLLGWLFKLLVRLLYGLKVRDVNCGFTLFRTALLKGMDLQSSSVMLHAEIFFRTRQQHATTREVGIHHYPRRTRRGAAFTLRALLRATREVVALRRRIRQERRAAREAEKRPTAGS